MGGLTRRGWLALAAPVAGGVLAWAYRPGRPAAPNPSAREAIRERHFPNVPLRTHDGRDVRFYDDLVKDKIVAVNFMYTRCEDGKCPLIMANLARVQRILRDRVGRDIFMYSITLKPEQDTPAVLVRYAQALGTGPGWSLLTGKPEDIELLRRRLGFVQLDPVEDADKSNHIGGVRYGNEALRWWGMVPGLANPEWIARTILFADWPKDGSIQVKPCC